MNVQRTVLVSALFFAAGFTSLHAQRSYAIVGTLFTGTDIIHDGTMYVVDGKIKDIGHNIRVPSGTQEIRVDGVVFPGFIDLHNHVVWNVFPRWKPVNPVGDRYEWQAMDEYLRRLEKPEGELIAAGSGCDMERYGEIKELFGGATSVVGSFSPTPSDPHRNDCVKGLARNLDTFSALYTDGVNAEPLLNEIFPLEIDWQRATTIRNGLASGVLKAVIFHLAEGKDASARREFRMFKARGFLRPGASIVHGAALQEADFREMAANGVGLVWSPRSNMELYDQTADVVSAKAAGVTIALAPDWSPTGSSGILEELRTASRWNRDHGKPFSDRDLLQMITTNPARLAGVSDRIGSLAVGMEADFVILPRKKDSSPLEAATDNDAAGIMLVAISGRPLLGDATYLGRFSGGTLELIKVCGREKAFRLSGDMAGDTLGALQHRLAMALKSVGSSLASLSDCQ